MTTSYVYKIKRISDGKYANGKKKVSFTKKGKTWVSLSSLKLHLNSMIKNRWQYNDCVVVEYSIDTENFSTLDLIDEYKLLAVMYVLQNNEE